MKKVIFLVLLPLLTTQAISQSMHLPGKFVHSVYFWLKNPDSQEDRDVFLASLYHFVQNSEYITSYHIAPPANTPREVVDNSYTYNLVATFESKELQDKYQNEVIHKKFISDSEHLWKEVRIYDSFQNDQPPATDRFARPDIMVGVVVSDMERSLDFYENVIGMKKTGGFHLNKDFSERSGLAGGTELDISILKLVDSPHATEWKMMSVANTKSTDTDFIQGQTGLRYVTLLVENINPVLERIRSHNVAFQGKTPFELDDGRTFVLVRDPDGIFIEIIGPAE